MLSFSTVKGIRIPEGDVIKITRVSDQTILWQAAYDAIVNGVSPLTLPSAVRAAVVYLKQQGVCEQNGTPTPTNPVDIKCNNGKLKVADDELPDGYRRLIGINFDGNVFYDTGMRLYGSDTLKFKFKVSIACNVLGCYTSASAQTNYSLYVGTSTANYLRYNGGTYNSRIDANDWYDVTITPTGSNGMKTDSNWTSKSFTTDSDLLIGTTSYGATSAKLTGALEGNVVILGREIIIPCERVSDGKFGYYMKSANRFIENQGTGTPTSLGYDYSHFVLTTDGTSEIITLGQQNANAENLFAVGGYKDEQDIISGNIVRKTGIMILDGETELENGSGFSNDGRVHFYIGYSSILNNETRIASSTHFASTDIYGLSMPNNTIIGYFDSIKNYRIEIKNTNWTTLSDYVNFMKAQYEAGTPVIIIYPLADEITEQVTPQPLDTEEGDNVITVTAEVSNIPLEVKYKRT